MFEWEQAKEIIGAVVFGVIAFVGGMVSYLSSSVTRKTKIVFKEMLIKGLSSGFAGLLVGWIMMYYQCPMTLICAITGFSGYIGSELTINIIKAKLTKELGIKGGVENGNKSR